MDWSNVSIFYEGSALDSTLAEWKSELKSRKTAFKAVPRPEFKIDARNESLIIPSEVGYIAQGYNLGLLGSKVNGRTVVLKKVLDTDYLWEKIRVKGGAYGAYMDLSMDGNMAFVSYRDPNTKETLKAYTGAAEHLENIDKKYDSLDKFIIGSIAGVDRPITKIKRLEIAMKAVREGMTDDKRQAVKDEVLGTSVLDIKAFAPLIKAVSDKNVIAAVGGSRLAKEGEGVFTKIDA